MRGLISFVLVAVTVVVQLTIVDRIAFPGGAGPNLVLIAVAALGLASGPMAGVLTGFWGGLALDVAPPGSHFTGQDALVFCLVGYFCGLLADDTSGDGSTEQGHTALFEILVTAAGAICGEALAALLGVMLSDPRVTWPAVTHVLPVAVAYDVLLCPFVLYAVAAALRLAGPRGEGARVGWSPRPARTAVPAASQGAVRQVTGANTPRLRLSERGPASLSGRYGAGAGNIGSRPGSGREPRLKLGRPAMPRGPLAGGLGAAFGSGGLGASPARVRFGGRRREGVFGGSLLGSAGPGGLGLAGSGLGSARFSSSRMGRSLLGGSVFSRSPSALGKPSSLGRPSLGRPVFGRPVFGRPVFGRPAPLGRSSPFRHRASLMGPPRGGLAGHVPRFSRGGSLGRLTAALRRSAGPKSPGRGWLRDVSARRTPLSRSSLGRSSLGRNLLGRNPLNRGTLSRGAFGRGRLGRGWTGATPGLRARRSGPARLRMPRPKSKRSWRTGGYR